MDRYAGTHFGVDTALPHLGGNVLEGDPQTFAPTVWNYVIERFALRSVLDIGSGIGYAADYFFRRGLRVLAVDGLPVNVTRAVYPTLQIDLTQSAVRCVVDFVHCQEVVEHIADQHVENVLASLACGRFVLMTHALPGQGGYHHVNEQEPGYWIDHMRRHDLVVLEEDTRRIRELAQRDGASYLAQTGMLFGNVKAITG